MTYEERSALLFALLTVSLSAAAQKLLVDSLPGTMKTYYTLGRINQAKATQQLIQAAVTFYEHQFPTKSFAVPPYVVDKVQMPFYDDSTNHLAAGTIPQRMAVTRWVAATPSSPADTVDSVAVHELDYYFQTKLC